MISWLTFWIIFISPFGLLAWFGILIYLIYKKSKLKWYLILSAWLFVPGCYFLKGTAHYFKGNAYLLDIGAPRRYHGIDRDTRVVSTSSSCFLFGFEWFVFPANNAAVIFWTNLLGYQRGAYKGVFPTEEEAQEIIDSADTIMVIHTDNFLEFHTAEQTVKMDSSYFYSHRSSSSTINKVVGKTINNECFIFQRLCNSDDAVRKPIYVVDISKNKLLTTYFDYY